MLYMPDKKKKNETDKHNTKSSNQTVLSTIYMKKKRLKKNVLHNVQRCYYS